LAKPGQPAIRTARGFTDTINLHLAHHLPGACHARKQSRASGRGKSARFAPSTELPLAVDTRYPEPVLNSPDPPERSQADLLRFWLERQRYDRVVEEGYKLLARDPDDPDLHRTLAIAWWSQGDGKRAEHHLRESLRTRPDDASSQAFLALLRSNPLVSRSSDRHAIAALALDPDSIIAWQALGCSALADDGEFAMQCARRILQLDPENIEARVLMFGAISQDEEKPGWHQAAERWLQEGLAIQPEDAGLHGLLGGHLIDTPERGKEGEAHLRTALSLDPQSSQAAGWRETIANKRDRGLFLLNLPKKFFCAPIFASGRALNRYPWLILLGKFFLIAVVLCLMGLILWLIFLWPVVRLYRYYVVHGDLLRARVSASRFVPFAWLVPTPAWLRRIAVVAAMLLWWRLVPVIFSGINRLHPSLHAGNVVAIGGAAIVLGGIVLLAWLEIRKRGRKRAMRGVSGAP
jgi:tetratricopeptide (TPR) repeat protein